MSLPLGEVGGEVVMAQPSTQRGGRRGGPPPPRRPPPPLPAPGLSEAPASTPPPVRKDAPPSRGMGGPLNKHIPQGTGEKEFQVNVLREMLVEILP